MQHDMQSTRSPRLAETCFPTGEVGSALIGSEFLPRIRDADEVTLREFLRFYLWLKGAHRFKAFSSRTVCLL